MRKKCTCAIYGYESCPVCKFDNMMEEANKKNHPERFEKEEGMQKLSDILSQKKLT